MHVYGFLCAVLFYFFKIRQTNRILFPTFCFCFNHFKKSITEEEKDGSDVYRIPMTPSTRTAFHFSSFSKKILKKKTFPINRWVGTQQMALKLAMFLMRNFLGIGNRKWSPVGGGKQQKRNGRKGMIKRMSVAFKSEKARGARTSSRWVITRKRILPRRPEFKM